MTKGNANSFDEGHIDKDMTPPENNRKRKLKTKAQLEALEEYYEVDKYPPQSVKLEIREKLGLTDKQVSGWFCHRRLKDKRLSKDEAFGNGRMDRSSGVIQDHYSGPGQDSCGSTKPGDHKLTDVREVQSQRLACRELPSINPPYYNRVDNAWYGDNQDDDDIDGTPSESSSPLRDSHLPQKDVAQTWADSRDLLRNGPAMPLNPTAAINKEFRQPSGYLKLMQKIEHPAIATIKRQLGKHFQVDGPPLGIQFEHPPIDAFQKPIKDTNLEPGDDFFLPGVSGPRYPGVRSGLDMHRADITPGTSFVDEQDLTADDVSEDVYYSRQFRPKATAPYLDKVYAEKTLNSQRGLFNRSKGMQRQSIPDNNFWPCNGTLATDGADVSFHASYVNPQIAPATKHLINDLSFPKFRQRQPHDCIGRKLYRREPQDEKLYRIRSGTPELHNHVAVGIQPDHDLMYEKPNRVRNDPPENTSPPRVRMDPENELKLLKQCKEAQFQYSKSDFAKSGSWENRGRGINGEVPSSFSEDETGDVSSS